MGCVVCNVACSHLHKYVSTCPVELKTEPLLLLRGYCVLLTFYPLPSFTMLCGVHAVLVLALPTKTAKAKQKCGGDVWANRAVCSISVVQTVQTMRMEQAQR